METLSADNFSSMIREGEGMQWSMCGDHKLNDNSDLVSFAPPTTVRRGRRSRLRSVKPQKEKYPPLPDMIERIVCRGKNVQRVRLWFVLLFSLVFVRLQPFICLLSHQYLLRLNRLLVSPLSTPASSTSLKSGINSDYQ